MLYFNRLLSKQYTVSVNCLNFFLFVYYEKSFITQRMFHKILETGSLSSRILAKANKHTQRFVWGWVYYRTVTIAAAGITYEYKLCTNSVWVLCTIHEPK